MFFVALALVVALVLVLALALVVALVALVVALLMGQHDHEHSGVTHVLHTRARSFHDDLLGVNLQRLVLLPRSLHQLRQRHKHFHELVSVEHRYWRDAELVVLDVLVVLVVLLWRCLRPGRRQGCHRAHVRANTLVLVPISLLTFASTIKG